MHAQYEYVRARLILHPGFQLLGTSKYLIYTDARNCHH